MPLPVKTNNSKRVIIQSSYGSGVVLVISVCFIALVTSDCPAPDSAALGSVTTSMYCPAQSQSQLVELYKGCDGKVSWGMNGATGMLCTTTYELIKNSMGCSDALAKTITSICASASVITPTVNTIASTATAAATSGIAHSNHLSEILLSTGLFTGATYANLWGCDWLFYFVAHAQNNDWCKVMTSAVMQFSVGVFGNMINEAATSNVTVIATLGVVVTSTSVFMKVCGCYMLYAVYTPHQAVDIARCGSASDQFIALGLNLFSNMVS